MAALSLRQKNSSASASSSSGYSTGINTAI
uniref:Uncharacterized protein n=1 Tax=Siphoviridae sp. ct0cq5 TaxID=2825296 RepID=A0A8S5PHH9_9CAUD|nr:MAG TPA: hypothetical protein [Siphoviridae sp. ct0cq5]